MLIAVSFLTFTFVSVAVSPTGFIEATPGVDFRTIEDIRERKHLDEPIPIQYLYWVKEVTTERFGTTLLGDRPIWPDIQRVMGNTLQLLIIAELLAILIAVFIGVYSAVRQYSAFDYSATTFSFLGLATPNFWLALMLQILVVNILLKFDVRLFYVQGLSSADPGTGLSFVLDRAQHLALPIIVIAVANIAVYSRFMRASMLEVINSDYVRTAKAKGLGSRKVIMEHAFRNALIPLVTLIALNFGALFGGAVVVETVFGLDGMGFYFITSLNEGDPYPIMAWLMITATLIIVFNLIADIVYGYLDPRVRYE